MRPIERTERIALGEAAGRVAAATSASVCRAAVRPIGDGRLRGRRRRHARAPADSAVRLGIVERIYTGQLRRVPSPRHLRRDRDRRADARWRRCRGHGRGNGARQAAESVEILAAAAAGQNIGRRGADIRPGDLVVRRGDVLNAGPRRGAGRRRMRRVSRCTRGPRVAVLSTGNEVVEPGHGAGARPDLRRQPVHARRRHRRATVGVPEPHPPVHDTLEALEGRARWLCGR